MTGRLSFRFFAHSWISDWNHGNAHFLRGLASELVKLGHEVRCYEERDGWSIKNLAAEGENALPDATLNFRQAFPTLDVRFYSSGDGLCEFLEAELAGADVVVIHEWNSPEVIAAILELKDRFRFRALFHDTHHRAYTSPHEILRLPLNEFDGVLAFGDAIRRIYTEGFSIRRAWTFHEGADIDRFFPLEASKDTDVVWIGNWGDGESHPPLCCAILRSPCMESGIHRPRLGSLSIRILSSAATCRIFARPGCTRVARSACMFLAGSMPMA